ncbi:hypothetical protein [Bradyrhizobium sp. 33ap4]|uniref:hypothetical protein n=1 Tax=Bradyrhizobium sp. 33ap4 TaxID=3061630 RepID=UPI002931D278|nr:hypothetical protein [Bradyrhizobium sp. 33ap4]
MTLIGHIPLRLGTIGSAAHFVRPIAQLVVAVGVAEHRRPYPDQASKIEPSCIEYARKDASASLERARRLSNGA